MPETSEALKMNLESSVEESWVDRLEEARTNIGTQRAKEFLELLFTGNTEGLNNFRAEYLTQGRLRENYGTIKSTFERIVGDTLARDYAGMFKEISMENTRYFFETRLQGAQSNILPSGIWRVIGKTLNQLYSTSD